MTKTAIKNKRTITKKHLAKLNKSVLNLTKHMNAEKPKENAINLELIYASQALRELSELMQSGVQVSYKTKIGFCL